MSDEALSACQMRVERDGHRLLVHVAGELDVATCAPLDALADQLGPDVREIVVDLAEVTFLDSSALKALMRLRKALGATRVVNPSRAAERVLRVTGLAELFGLPPAT